MPEVSPVPQPLPVKKMSKPVIVIFSFLGILVFSVLFFGLGYWYQGKIQTKKPTATPTPTPASQQLSTFTGQKLKISFQYPNEWGNVKEEIVPIGDAQNYHGNNYRLSFSRNPYLIITGASKDSSSPGVGGGCPIRQFFKGTEETGVLSCAKCNKEQEGCSGCLETTISNQPAVSYLYVPTSYCSILGFRKIVYLKTPFNQENSDFPGLVMELSIGSQMNSQLADTGYRSVASCQGDGAEQEQQRQYLANLFNQNRQELETSLLSQEPLDYLAGQQLKEFTSFLASIHFLPLQ